MANDVVLAATSGGDTARAIQKGTPKAQVVIVDLGGSSTEDLAAFPGVAGANLGKAEDAAHSSGHTGVLNLGVRRDTPAADTDNAGDYAALQVDANGRLWVAQAAARVQVTSAGLTTASTSYSIGDQVGNQIDLTGMALATGGKGILTDLHLADAADIIGVYSVALFRDDPTPASDNAAFSISDGDNDNLIDIITLQTVRDVGGARIATWSGARSYSLVGTTLYAALITETAHTFFAAVGNLKLEALGLLL